MKGDKSKVTRDGPLMEQLVGEMQKIVREKGIEVNGVQAKELIAKKIILKGGLNKEL